VSDMHSPAGEYAVGALSDEETRQFETHLETCPDCREEVAEMRETAVQLSEGVATDPPPTLRASVLQQIAQTAQDSAPPRPALVATTDEQELGRHLAEGATSADGAGGNVIPLQRGAQRRNRLVGLLAAAAVVVAVAMGGWAVQSRNDANQATAQAQQATQALNAAQALTQVLAAKDAKTASGSFIAGGNGTVVVSRSEGRALLVAADLPALPSGKVYEAWTFSSSPTPKPAGTFTARSAPAVVSLPAAAVSASQVAVTVEPSGGSQQPTSKPVFAVTLPHA
jgi:anti-sigma-K factor RskA